jgi:hypothetical protein
VSELYRPGDRRLSTKLVQTFEDKGRRVVSAANPFGRDLAFLDRVTDLNDGFILSKRR